MTTIILAAGLSSRMGENKLVLPYKGKTILEATLEAVEALGGRIVIVVGHEREKIEEIAERHHVETVFNPDYEKGQKGSSLKGVETIDDDFALLPGDLPLMTKEDLLAAFGALKEYPTSRLVHHQIPGHPVCYRKELRDKLLAYPGTMKDFLKEVGTTKVQASIGSIYDVDTKEKYQALLGFDNDLPVLYANLD